MANGGIDKIYFHEAESTINIGEEWWVSLGASTINIVVTGTATSFEMNFEGKLDETWSKVMGVRLDNLSLSDKADTKEKIYQVDLTGIEKFRCNLTSVTGGNVTVYGFAVD
jgi:hypothetical protein